MPDVQEVFRMATQKVGPDPGALERQHRDQRRHAARQKAAVFVLIGALVVGGVALGFSSLRDDTDAGSTQPADDASTSPLLGLPSGNVEPGRYVFASSDPGLDASHRITIEVPDGYEGFGGVAAVKAGTDQDAAVITLAISGVYADACQWEGTLLDRSAIQSNDDVVAALASQKGLRVSTPTDVTVDGFAGTYMERRVPARTRISDCDGAKTPEQQPVFNVYRSPGFGNRLLRPGQLQQLWILDIDGVPLVIDASIEPGTSAQVRAELVQMVESVRIDPR